MYPSPAFALTLRRHAVDLAPTCGDAPPPTCGDAPPPSCGGSGPQTACSMRRRPRITCGEWWRMANDAHSRNGSSSAWR